MLTWGPLLRTIGVCWLMHQVMAIPIDNGIVGQPDIQCGTDTVELQFATKKPFRGKVFVKGHYNSPDCRVDFSGSPELNVTRPTGRIIINHGACDMERQRMLNPQGIEFTAVVVVSFHRVFITKVDRAYSLKCNYREMTKTVTSSLDVSMLTTQQLGSTLDMPVCTYSIRKDKIDGDLLRYAKIGDQTVHRWDCPGDMYGMLVHSCLVEDGQGEKFEVIDEKGCTLDKYILGDPTYAESLSMAYRESHIFKFADRVTVQFQCQIKLCLKENDGCAGITPPTCHGGNNITNSAAPSASPSIYSHSTSIYEKHKLNDSLQLTTTPLMTPPIYRHQTEPTGPSRNGMGTSGAAPVAATTAPLNISGFDASQFDNLKTVDDNLKVWGGKGNSTGGLRYKRIPHRGISNPLHSPTDGDFKSQTLYVLDTTENPDKGTRADQQALQSFLRRAEGTVLAEDSPVPSVCLTRIAFILLLASVALMFVVSSVVLAYICCCRSSGSDDSHKRFGTLRFMDRFNSIQR